MRKILLILIILTSTPSFLAQECNYEEYYSLVDSAKKNYTEKKYKEAEKKLKLAFTKNEFPLGKDLSLALLVAQKRKDPDWAEQISIRLAKGGVPLRYFRKFKPNKWFDKFSADFRRYSDYYNENFKPELREKLTSLLERDKQFNAKYHQWRTREIEMTLQELIDGASDILLDFKKLINKYGFPYERLMGYNYNHKKNSVERSTLGTLIIHIYQRGELILQEDIHEIVCNGGLHPSYEKDLKTIRGFGDSTGIEQEMKIRFKKYRETKE